MNRFFDGRCAVRLAFVAAIVAFNSAAAPAQSSPGGDLVSAVPLRAEEFSPDAAKRLETLQAALLAWSQEQEWKEGASSDAVLAQVAALLDAKDSADEALEKLLAIRGGFAALADESGGRDKMRAFLRAATSLIDLSGRLRYLLRDVLERAVLHVAASEPDFVRLVELLTERRCSIGAEICALALFDPPPESGEPPFSAGTKYKVLGFIGETRSADLMPELADFTRLEKSPELVIMAAAMIKKVGLPQKPMPGQPEWSPPPVITARELHERLAKIDRSRLSAAYATHLDGLLAYLSERMTRGVVGDIYSIAGSELREGDWLMFKNPSPYNLFTDLSPGLFTHVGIVTAVVPDDGIRRFVIVEMPEQSDHVPASSVDAYLLRTLHYMFLRHPDPSVGTEMGRVAREVIGNETQFDLLFQTDRVYEMKGMPLAGRRINTYCAGFLLMCAQETAAPRDDFFPVLEHPAGGNCLKNLDKLGLAIGENFVSPTSAVFSPKLEIVGSREPMYSPGREVKEAVYDHFARAMIEQELTPSPDEFQALRERVAAMAKENPLLARVLAAAGGVSEHMDLESAAKAAAVVETLDEIAEGASAGYHQARAAFFAPPEAQLAFSGLDGETIASIRELRAEHSELFSRWTAGRLTPRELRIALVAHYQAEGKQRLDERFFLPRETEVKQ